MKALYTFLISCFCVGWIFSQTDIASVEYFFDTDPGFGNGTTIVINPNVALVDQNFSIPTSGLTAGTHRLFLRAVNIDGTSSMYEHKTFRVAPINDTNTSTIVEAEYFFDVDPGIGNGSLINVVDADNLNDILSVSTSGLSVGTHRLFVRVKNAVGIWSMYDHRTFRVAPVSGVNTSTLVEAEYFFDTDPGLGNATLIDIVDIDILDDMLSVSTSGLPIGTHRLFVRVKNAAGIWSMYDHKTFRVAPVKIINTASITAAEYFVDVDPGFGLATPIVVSGDILNTNLSLSTSVSLANGTHFLYIRTKNTDGVWSLYEKQQFTSDGALGVDDEALNMISIYPNPISNFMKISLSADNKIDKAMMYDMTGKEVLQIKDSFDNIDIGNLQSGVYLLIIKTEKGSVSKKIIKK